MKNSLIREKTDAELSLMLADLRRESFTLRIQGRTGQLQNTARPKNVRVTIARILTEQAKRAAKA